MLLYKLLKYNITGNVYSPIKSMYSECYYKIKCSNGVFRDPILSTSGLKQGCGLSPILSNIFQNDIHEIFSLDCDPIELQGLKLSSLSWADDLVLISRTASGLQNCLDKISDYCKK